MKALAVIVFSIFFTAVLNHAKSPTSSPRMPSDELYRIEIEVFEYKGESEKELFKHLSSIAQEEGITLTIRNNGEPIDFEQLHENTPLKNMRLAWIIQLLCVPNNLPSYDYGEDRDHIIVTMKKKLEPNDTDNPVNSPENPKNHTDDWALQAGCLVSTL